MAGFRVSVVRDELGLLTVAPEIPSASRAGRGGRNVLVSGLDVPGGRLSTGVDDGKLRITARIDDYAAAARWIETVYGSTVAKAVASVNSADEIVTRTAKARRPKSARIVGRLLLGLWMRRWWPAVSRLPAIEGWVLDAELGSLARRAREVTGNLDLATQLLSDGAVIAGLTRSLETLRDNPGSDPQASRFSRMAMRAARAAIDVLEPGNPGIVELEAANEAVTARGAASSATTKRLIDWASELASATIPAPVRAAVTGGHPDENETDGSAAGDIPGGAVAIAERVLTKRRKAVRAGDLSGPRAPFAFETYGADARKGQ